MVLRVSSSKIVDIPFDEIVALDVAVMGMFIVIVMVLITVEVKEVLGVGMADATTQLQAVLSAADKYLLQIAGGEHNVE